MIILRSVNLLVVLLGYVDKYEPVFQGIISDVTIEVEENGFPTVFIEAMDASVLMMNGEKHVLV